MKSPRLDDVSIFGNISNVSNAFNIYPLDDVSIFGNTTEVGFASRLLSNIR